MWPNVCCVLKHCCLHPNTLYPPSVIITLILCTVYDRTVVSLFKADRTVYITIINTTVIEIVLPHYFVSKSIYPSISNGGNIYKKILVWQWSMPANNMSRFSFT